MKVLIVDDTKSYRLLLKDYLLELGHQVSEAGDGQQAIEAYRQQGNKLDLILMDVEMPVVDGITAVKSIRDIQKAERIEWTPVIFLSVSAKESDLEASIVSGGDDYLVKPISRRVLSAKMLAMERIATMRQRLIEANAELRQLASTDPLTGVYNRRHFERAALSGVQQAYRHKRTMALAVLDLDHFKQINDTYGHDIGDKVLVTVCRAMNASLRSGDVFARLGGEEFGLLLADPDEDALGTILERYRQLIARQFIELDNKTHIQVTASIGAAILQQQQEEDFTHLYQRADQALYKAKRDGRNQVQLNND